MKVIFACTGNTCRSPMAEGFLHYYKEKYHLKIDIMSRGIMATDGADVNEHAKVSMEKHGIDISKHVAKGLRQHEMTDDMLILAMTQNHVTYIKQNYIVEDTQVYSLAEFVDGDKDISDPFGMSQHVYDACAQAIKEYVEEAAKRILEEY